MPGPSGVGHPPAGGGANQTFFKSKISPRSLGAEDGATEAHSQCSLHVPTDVIQQFQAMPLPPPPKQNTTPPRVQDPPMPTALSDKGGGYIFGIIFPAAFTFKHSGDTIGSFFLPFFLKKTRIFKRICLKSRKGRTWTGNILLSEKIYTHPEGVFLFSGFSLFFRPIFSWPI